MASECMLIDALISGLPRCCCCANADCPPHRVDCLSHQVRLLCQRMPRPPSVYVWADDALEDHSNWWDARLPPSLG